MFYIKHTLFEKTREHCQFKLIDLNGNQTTGTSIDVSILLNYKIINIALMVSCLQFTKIFSQSKENSSKSRVQIFGLYPSK